MILYASNSADGKPRQNGMLVCRHCLMPLIVLLAGLVLSIVRPLTAAATDMQTAVHDGPLSAVISIVAEESQDGTTVKIRGNGSIPGYKTRRLDSPLRLAVDIFCSPLPAQPQKTSFNSPRLKVVTVSTDAHKIRAELLLKGPALPATTTMVRNNELTVLFKAPPHADPVQAPKTVKPPSIKHPPSRLPKVARIYKLLKLEAIEQTEDVSLWNSAVRAYKGQKWQQAVKTIQHLNNLYPTGLYAEKAHFLLAKSYAQLYSEDTKAHFADIRSHYENAVSRFASSEYVIDAMLSIGNLLFQLQNYSEAQAYYNLVLKKDSASAEALQANIQKAKIFRLRAKYSEALAILTQVLDRYPATNKTTTAKVEMAKVLYEMNSFRKSINILIDLKTADPRVVYRHPQIALYLGYNYHQLGDHGRARLPQGQ